MEHVIVEMSFPTRVVLGPQALSRVPDKVATLGMKKPLVVTDAGLVKAGIVDRLSGVLGQARIAHARFDQVEANPSEGDVERGVAAYKENHCDGVIAIGGGSSLDVGKLVRLAATHTTPLAKYAEVADLAKHIGLLPPMMAIPTTAGTGSEVAPFAVIFLKESGRKTAISAAELIPSVAIVDPELTMDLPQSITAATGLHAFAHCLESYMASGYHPLADAMAIDGVGRVARHLERAVIQGKTDLEARTEMMIAALEGAMASQKGLGAANALAQAITPIAGIHHGLGAAIVLPCVLDFNRGSVGGRLAKVAVAMGDNSLSRDEVLTGLAIDQVRQLCKRIGIPETLSKVGLKADMLPAIADKAFADPSHHTNPRKVTRDDLLAIAKAAF